MARLEHSSDFLGKGIVTMETMEKRLRRVLGQRLRLCECLRWVSYDQVPDVACSGDLQFRPWDQNTLSMKLQTRVKFSLSNVSMVHFPQELHYYTGLIRQDSAVLVFLDLSLHLQLL